MNFKVQEMEKNQMKKAKKNEDDDDEIDTNLKSNHHD